MTMLRHEDHRQTMCPRSRAPRHSSSRPIGCARSCRRRWLRSIARSSCRSMFEGVRHAWVVEPEGSHARVLPSERPAGAHRDVARRREGAGRAVEELEVELVALEVTAARPTLAVAQSGSSASPFWRRARPITPPRTHTPRSSRLGSTCPTTTRGCGAGTRRSGRRFHSA